MADPFSYAPLPKGFIRLLTFTSPSTSPGRLTCTIDTVSLDDPPQFYALSYAWGSPSTTEGILCNEREMQIALNLHEAIQILFSPPLSLNLPIWIDAICIDQKDDEEKSHQVYRMGDVYRRAYKVVVWLGPASEDSDLAMDSLSWLSTALPQIPRPICTSELQKYELPDQDSPIWPALGHLYGRSWFGRLWTFQEVVLAVDSLVVCGQKRVGSTRLITVGKELEWLCLRLLCFGYQEIDIHRDGIIAMIFISFAREELASIGSLEPTSLLRIADWKLCSDPRDKVYALLGMTSSSFKNCVQISYSNGSDRDILEAFIEYAKACIVDKVPTILQLVAGRPRIHGLPSWCPNLHSVPRANLDNLFDESLRAGIAAKNSTREMFGGKTHPESSKLSVTGFQVDTVTEVVDGSFYWPPLPPGDEHRQRGQRFLEWEDRCLALAQATLFISTETVPIDHVLTLSAATNRRSPHKPQDDGFLEAYHTLLRNIRKETFGSGSILPPVRSLDFYFDLWQRICKYSTGRKYFSTENGRLGLGPPEITKGDTVSVFYGAKTVSILRPAKENPEEWYFVGDAFVHGLMELDETPQSARGADEVFTII
jgi:hypothetical protein